MFVDPITCQVFAFVNENHCFGAFKHAFPLDSGNKTSWYRLMLTPLLFKIPSVIVLQDIDHITEFSVNDS